MADKIEIKKTGRGFGIGTFTDRYGAACTIQESSLASEGAIWLGVKDADPQIMVSDATRLGRLDLLTRDGKEALDGWVAYPLPPEVHMTTRMHLTQDMVRELLPLLEHFARTGNLP